MNRFEEKLKFEIVGQSTNRPIANNLLGNQAAKLSSSSMVRNGLKRKAIDTCPIATQDLQVNLKNRQNAIDNVGYGPLNPAEPNDEFWAEKAQRWDITPDEAKTALCGNCVFFIRTPSMLECLETGIGLDEEAEGSIDAGELGYCSALDFKCASKRTCNAWAAGGPITEE